MAKKKIRILIDTTIDGHRYLCNEVVNLDAKLAKAQVDIGAADDDASAVKYCTDDLRQSVTEHDQKGT